MNNGEIDIVLGFDPGFTKPNPSALALVSRARGVLLDHQTFTPDVDDPWEIRLVSITAWLDAYLSAHTAVEAVGYEIPFCGRNPLVAVMLAHLGGVMQTLAWLHGLPCAMVRPAQAKVALAHKGNATKDEMMAAVKHLWRVDLSKDEADAVGIALAAADLVG